MIRPDEPVEDFHLWSDAKPIGRPTPDPERMGVDGSGVALYVLVMLTLVLLVAALWVTHWLLGHAIAEAAVSAGQLYCPTRAC
jgi:hypothetical protein